MAVDTSAVLAILFSEADATAYLEAIDAVDDLVMSAGTFSELGIILRVRLGDEAPRVIDSLLLRSGLAVEPLTEMQARSAWSAYQRFGKGLHPAGLNFGDCFAYALAKERGEPLLFKGNDFAQTDIESALA